MGGRVREWVDGKPHGRGVAIKPDNSRYEGQWKNGKPHGIGVTTRSDNTRQAGNYENGEFVGD